MKYTPIELKWYRNVKKIQMKNLLRQYFSEYFGIFWEIWRLFGHFYEKNDIFHLHPQKYLAYKG